MTRFRTTRNFLLILSIGYLGACGQIGPLYLPEPVEQAQPTEEDQEQDQSNEK